MHRRRLATSVAATAALVLMGAGPALADHINPDDFTFDAPEGFDGTEDSLQYEGNLTCVDFGLSAPPAADGWDGTGKVDPPVDIDNEFVTATLFPVDADTGNQTHLTVVAKEGFTIAAVLVKGGRGGGGTAYFHGPFEDMTANEIEGKAQAISHYTICGEETPPPPPPDDENGKDEEENGDEKDENGEEEEDEKPEVPTEVPAGHEGSSSGFNAGALGLIAAATALVAGAAALVRRRFVHGS